MPEHKVRLQFDFSQEMVTRIDAMRKRLDAGSKAEVVRRAFKLLELSMSNENKIIFRDVKGVEQVLKII
jgi:hypothetical protein